jgi:hypothetical protein
MVIFLLFVSVSLKIDSCIRYYFVFNRRQEVINTLLEWLVEDGLRAKLDNQSANSLENAFIIGRENEACLLDYANRAYRNTWPSFPMP